MSQYDFEVTRGNHRDNMLRSRDKQWLSGQDCHGPENTNKNCILDYVKLKHPKTNKKEQQRKGTATIHSEAKIYRLRDLLNL